MLELAWGTDEAHTEVGKQLDHNNILWFSSLMKTSVTGRLVYPSRFVCWSLKGRNFRICLSRAVFGNRIFKISSCVKMRLVRCIRIQSEWCHNTKTKWERRTRERIPCDDDTVKMPLFAGLRMKPIVSYFDFWISSFEPFKKIYFSLSPLEYNIYCDIPWKQIQPNWFLKEDMM